MDKRLDVKVDGERIGNIQITRLGNHHLEITSNVIPNGDYLFTQEEIEEMIRKKLSTQKRYEGKKIEITEYPDNVEFVATVGDYPNTNFIKRNQD